MEWDAVSDAYEIDIQYRNFGSETAEVTTVGGDQTSVDLSGVSSLGTDWEARARAIRDDDGTDAVGPWTIWLRIN